MTDSQITFDPRNPRTPNEVRAALESILGDGMVTEEIWRHLVAGAHVTSVLQMRHDMNWLADEVHRLRKLKGLPIVGERRIPDIVEKRKDYRHKRAEVVSLLRAREAAADLGVQAFREQHLGRKLLKSSDVEAWVNEEAAKSGPPTWWLRGIPVPSNRKLRQRLDNKAGVFTVPPLCISRERPAEGCQLHLLRYGVPGAPRLRVVPTVAGSVLEELRVTSATLAKRVGWSEAAAVLFILTGATPLMEPIDWILEVTRGRVVLEIDAAMTPREVADAYLEARRALTEERPRMLSEKHLALATWIAEQPLNDLRSSKERMRAWNKGKRKRGWTYNRPENFARDVEAAERRLLRWFLPKRGRGASGAVLRMESAAHEIPSPEKRGKR